MRRNFTVEETQAILTEHFPTEMKKARRVGGPFPCDRRRPLLRTQRVARAVQFHKIWFQPVWAVVAVLPT
jgi:hypothetical protein